MGDLLALWESLAKLIPSSVDGGWNSIGRTEQVCILPGLMPHTFKHHNGTKVAVENDVLYRKHVHGTAKDHRLRSMKGEICRPL
jgi:hypothetical protein